MFIFTVLIFTIFNLIVFFSRCGRGLPGLATKKLVLLKKVIFFSRCDKKSLCLLKHKSRNDYTMLSFLFGVRASGYVLAMFPLTTVFSSVSLNVGVDH
jgi:hypothetical protein